MSEVAAISPPTTNGRQENGLSGRLTTLRALHERDFPVLYEWRTDMASVHLWSASRRPMTFDQFQQELRAMTTGNMMLVFEIMETGQPFGFSQVAQIDTQHGHASILFFICRDFRSRRMHSLDAALLLQRYLFEYFPFRKLYAEVLEYNRDSKQALEKLGWRLEGRFREHAWFRDRFWDLLRFSIGRTEWQAIDAAWHERFARRAPQRKWATEPARADGVTEASMVDRGGGQ